MILQRLAVTDDALRRPAYWRGPAEVAVDGGLAVDAGGTLDLGTWLNAAPVGWWRSLLGAKRVRLTVTGHGRLTVWAAVSGARREMSSTVLDGRWEHDLGLDGLDFAWITLDAAADDARAAVTALTWELVPSVGSAELPRRPLTVVVPTYRAEDDALAQLARLTAPALDGVVGRVVLIDQSGTLAAHPGTAEALAEAGDRVLFVEQPNLGGSGGYARGLLEGSERWPEDPIFLHDDDAVVEPEALARLVALASLAPNTFFGTGLLDVDAPTHLQALAEGVARGRFQWGPVDGVGDGVDVGVGSPATWAFTHPTDRAEYGGWWGCLVPAGAPQRLGLAAPYFIKWDDAEYGLRAGRAGYDAATLPGFAVWSQTWATKGTSSSWSSWPLHRNRLATAAAYGAGRGVLLDSLLHQIKHVLSLQYDTAELWNAAVEEFAGGPAWLEGDLTTVRPRAQALLDGVRRRTDAGPRGRPTSLASPAAFTWQVGLRHGVVAFDDGSEPMVRDRSRAWRAFVRAVRGHGRAALRWQSLRSAYARHLVASASTSSWRARFPDVAAPGDRTPPTN